MLPSQTENEIRRSVLLMFWFVSSLSDSAIPSSRPPFSSAPCIVFSAFSAFSALSISVIYCFISHFTSTLPLRSLNFSDYSPPSKAPSSSVNGFIFTASAFNAFAALARRNCNVHVSQVIVSGNDGEYPIIFN